MIKVKNKIKHPSYQDQTFQNICESYENQRYTSLHQAVKQYKKLNEKLGLKLFDFLKKNKRQTQILIRKKICRTFHEQNREEYLDRKTRREVLGLQQADLENYQNLKLRKSDSMKKRKNVLLKKKASDLSQHVKGRYNMKGFAARIDHNLGRERGGVRGLTKMINTDLLSAKPNMNYQIQRKAENK